MKKIWLSIVVLLALAIMPNLAVAQYQLPQNMSPVARQGGTFYATAFATWKSQVVSGNTTTGSGTSITVLCPGPLQDGTVWACSTLFSATMLNPIIVSDNNAETVTPTAVSIAACPAGNTGFGSQNCATITGTFNNTHGQSAVVQSGSLGLGEAVSAVVTTSQNAAAIAGGGPQIGGAVVVDGPWAAMGGTSAMIVALTPYPNVMIEDIRGSAPQFWTLAGNGTAIAVPTTLVSTTVGDALAGTAALATGGHYTNAAAYYVCIAYVDVMGQEGACSATYSFTPATGSTNQIGFTTPAASAGAVGYTIYISLTSGTYQLAYKVPLVTQPTVTGAYPVSNGVCTLTTVEMVTPACAVKNTTYGQVGSQAVVSAITLSTSPIDPQVTVVSTTSVYTPNAGGQTAYVYTPSSHVGTSGLVSSVLPFTISAADATTVPSVIGTVNLPPGFMNYVGRTLEICGYATTGGSTGTIQNIQFQWDAMGQNTAGKGVLIGNLTATETATSVLQMSFCEDFQTTVAAATATGGSIQDVGGFMTSGIASLSAAAAGANTLAGAIGSLNLADDARINVIYLHTTGTDGTAVTLRGLTAKVIN